MKNKIVITGGGTGGHLKVADAFIENLYKKGIEIIYIGSSNGQDKAWFENDKRISQKYFFDTKGVVNKKFIGKILSLLNIFSKTLECLKIYSKNDIKKVISVGGYSAAAGSFAGILKPSCNLYIHEQNSKMGTLNKLTSKAAKYVFSSYDENSLVKDYPVDEMFFENARIRQEVKTIAFLGGSQGAVAINDFALKVASKLDKMGIKIIHQAGKTDYERVKKEYENLGIKADVFDFTKDIISKMKEADFSVSRAGASTLWETVANALPTFFIPYPYAAAQKDLDEEYFFNCLNSDIKIMSASLKLAIEPNAIDKIVDEILK